MSGRARGALSLLLAVVVVGSMATAGAAGTAAPGASPQVTTTDLPADTDGTVITIRLRADGDARWSITTRFNVSGTDDREAFREFASRYESGQVNTPRLETMRRTVEAAEAGSGRTMNLTGARRTSDVANATLTLSFVWTEFARQEGEQLVVDDAFNTTGGTWLEGLTADQVLLVELPPDATLQRAPRGAVIEGGRVRWEGPQTFEPGYMEIAYRGNTAAVTTRTTTPGDRDTLLLWGSFFVVGLGIVLVGGYVITRRREGLREALPGERDPPPAEATVPEETQPTETAAGADESEELLSDEERVERLLAANGGRMKQADIVKETGWSNAKVSQLLSAMAEADRVDKLRIGRENLISFPDEDVTGGERD